MTQIIRYESGEADEMEVFELDDLTARRVSAQKPEGAGREHGPPSATMQQWEQQDGESDGPPPENGDKV